MEELELYDEQIREYSSMLGKITDDKEYDMILIKLNYIKSLRNTLANRLLGINYLGLYVTTMQKLEDLEEEDEDINRLML